MVIPVVLGVAGAIQQEPAAVRLARIRSNHSEIQVGGLSITPGMIWRAQEGVGEVPVGTDTTPVVRATKIRVQAGLGKALVSPAQQ